MYKFVVSYIDVHIGVSGGVQPLLGASATLNCAVTVYPQLNQNILPIQYQWYVNSTLRGSVQELVLSDLSPADATTYSCNVTIRLVSSIIHNQSTYDLMIGGTCMHYLINIIVYNF